jgi:hypothetical protein
MKTILSYFEGNEPLGAKGPPLVGEEVRNKDVGKSRKLMNFNLHTK